MNKKSKLTSWMTPRNMLYLLIILIIVGVGYLLFTSYSNNSDDAISVGDAINNFEEYQDKTVKVWGYYYNIDNTSGELVTPRRPSMSVPNPGERILLIDHSGVKNATSKFNSGEKHIITGKLIESSPGDGIENIVLVATNIKIS